MITLSYYQKSRRHHHLQQMNLQVLSSGFYFLPGLVTSFLASGFYPFYPFYLFYTSIPYVLCRKQISDPKIALQWLLFAKHKFLGIGSHSFLRPWVSGHPVSWVLRLHAFLSLQDHASLSAGLPYALVPFLVCGGHFSEYLWHQWVSFYMLLNSKLFCQSFSSWVVITFSARFHKYFMIY